jgi:hypothetical protein
VIEGYAMTTSHAIEEELNLALDHISRHRVHGGELTLDLTTPEVRTTSELSMGPPPVDAAETSLVAWRPGFVVGNVYSGDPVFHQFRISTRDGVRDVGSRRAESVFLRGQALKRSTVFAPADRAQ